MDELVLLRDVARAAAAFVKAFDLASAQLESCVGSFSDASLPRRNDPREARRLCDASHEARTVLDQTLARLAEVNPGLVNG